MEYQKVLSIKNIPDHLKKIPYEAEGPIQTKVESYKESLSQGNKLPFDKLMELQEGDSQKLGQPQISFLRQAMACTFYPELMKQKIYSEDVMKRAQSYLDYFLTIGVYPDAQGFDDCRASISKFLLKRDGYPSDPNIIFTTAGAIHGINSIVEFLIKDKHKDGIMLPIPSHPILTASIYSEGGKVVQYELDEENNWEIQIQELKNSYEKAVQAGTNVKGLIIINPNNPSGQVLSEGKIKEIIQFCYDHRLAILADEIYQDNIYNPKQKFISFKKVLMDMGKTYSESLQLISFNSVSAGYYGECGLRGGFMELLNIEEGVLKNLYKLDGMYSTPNNSGQLALELMANPPSKENNCSQETIDLFNKEILQIQESQKKRAKIVTDYLKQCKNLKAVDINGSLYAFPQIQLSNNAQKAAEDKGLTPDTFYCFECLDQTGIALRPGTEFGQKAGTHHFRISILQYDVAQMEEIMKKFKAFNEKFHEKYA